VARKVQQTRYTNTYRTLQKYVARATQIRSIFLFSHKGTQVHNNPYKHSYQTGNKAFSTCGGAKTSIDRQFFLNRRRFSHFFFLSRSIICADCATERNSKKILIQGFGPFSSIGKIFYQVVFFWLFY